MSDKTSEVTPAVHEVSQNIATAYNSNGEVVATTAKTPPQPNTCTMINVNKFNYRCQILFFLCILLIKFGGMLIYG